MIPLTRDEQWLLEEKYGGVETLAYENDKARLTSGEPVAYVIGSQPFLGLTIHLDSHPLIPRVETEWWTEQMLNAYVQAEPGSQNSVVRLGLAARSATESWLPGEAPLRFLDLCAGSGAIGCSALARLLHTQIYFGEIDPAHEKTILKNIHKNNLDESRAEIRIGDLFEPFHNERFDLIAINPPYIPVDRKLEKSVSDYEPAQALFAGDDGLDLLRRIAVELPHHFTERGEAWIEIDSPHTETTQALFSAQGFSTTLRTDQYGAFRVLVVSFP